MEFTYQECINNLKSLSSLNYTLLPSCCIAQRERERERGTNKERKQQAVEKVLLETFFLHLLNINNLASYFSFFLFRWVFGNICSLNFFQLAVQAFEQLTAVIKWLPKQQRFFQSLQRHVLCKQKKKLKILFSSGGKREN